MFTNYTIAFTIIANVNDVVNKILTMTSFIDQGATADYEMFYFYFGVIIKTLSGDLATNLTDAAGLKTLANTMLSYITKLNN